MSCTTHPSSVADRALGLTSGGKGLFTVSKIFWSVSWNPELKLASNSRNGFVMREFKGMAILAKSLLILGN